MFRSYAWPFTFLFGVVFAVVASTACGQTTAETAAAAGGTPAPDGANGYCCPAHTGGCALMGGYREGGDCPQHADICDNMCEQRIVKDAHGCDVLTYKQPPVSTTFASEGSCSDPAFNGGTRDSGTDSGVDSGVDAGSDATPDSG